VDRNDDMKDKLVVKVTAESVYKHKLLRRISMIAVSVLLLFTSAVYAVIYMINQTGNFTISLDPNLKATQNIIMSPYSDFREESITLVAQSLDYMDNISESWLPDNLDEQEGEHSKDNYIAYTFFLKNAGENIVDYKASINIRSVIKGVDEAVRVKVYHNGEKIVYAKVNKSTKEPEPNTTPFTSNTRVMEQSRKKFEPGEVDRFTIIIWLEGDDPECVDDILGGEMKMFMLISEDIISDKSK
jgi:hypothetical protein